MALGGQNWSVDWWLGQKQDSTRDCVGCPWYLFEVFTWGFVEGMQDVSLTLYHMFWTESFQLSGIPFIMRLLFYSRAKRSVPPKSTLMNRLFENWTRYPCKNGTGILARSRQDSRRDSWRDSWRVVGFPAAKISAGSRRESCRDSWREAGSRRPISRRDCGGSLARILGGRRDSRQPKSRQDPGGSLAGILGG